MSSTDDAGTTVAAAPRERVGRMERSALMGVFVREIINFSSFWKSSTFASTIEPTIYLLGFGLGVGTLISTVNGVSYVEYIGTGMVANAVLFASAMTGMFSTFVKYKFQYTYDAIIAAPVDTEELVTAEALWISARAGVYGCAPMLVAMLFGLDPSWGMLLVPLIGFLTGFGWACFGICVAAMVPAIESFNYITSAVITPLFLVSGTFFPIDQLPPWAQAAAQVNPLHHCVELVRHAAFGLEPRADLIHVAVICAFAIVMWRLAVWRMERRLIA